MQRELDNLHQRVEELESQLRSLIGGRRSGWLTRAASGGGAAIVCKTPSGGIPARNSGSEPHTLGSASCTLGEVYDDSGTIKMRSVSPAASETVYNTVESAVAGNTWIQAKKINGFWCVDVEDCSGS